MGPSATPLGDKPAHSAIIHTVVDPKTAEIQARTPEPVPYSSVERPNTASQGAPRSHRRPTAVASTPTPVLEVNVPDFTHSDSVQPRDVLPPLQLPPLPTTRSKPSSQLDISEGLEDGGKTSGRGETNKEGGSYSSATLEPSLGFEKEQQPALVFKEDVTPGPGLIFDKSPAVPAVEESAKPPFHLIIVNVNNQNQSGE